MRIMSLLAHRSASAFLLGLLAAACGSDHADAPLDAGQPPDRALEGGPPDAGFDGSAPDAGDGGLQGCISPFENIGLTHSGAPGCSCEDSEAHFAGYCVEGTFFFCDGGKWFSGADGTCAPAEPLTMEACEQRGGAGYPAEPDVGLNASCPAPLAYIGRIGDDTTTVGPCCKPIVVSSSECAALEADTFTDPGDGSLSEAGCPDGRKLLAHVVGFDEGALCCAP
jgi:hypothetical protein